MVMRVLSGIGLLLLGQLAAVEALPQVLTAPICTTRTSTRLGLVGASITNGDEFISSMVVATIDINYSTPGVVFSGTRVYVYTSIYTYPGGSFTGYGIYDSHALTKAGFSITTVLNTITSCRTAAPTTPTLPPSPTGSACTPHNDHWHCVPNAPSTTASASSSTTTYVLPPSPTGSLCTPHDDHWHCEPNAPSTTKTPVTTSTTTTAVGTCAPHGDHWHCPPGVPEPSEPPVISTTSRSTTTTSSAPPVGTCTAHDDHWHCPPGVPEPPNPPTLSTTGKSSSVSSTGTKTTTKATTTMVAGECIAHDDHWHCPPGVSEPTTLPPTEHEDGEEEEENHDHEDEEDHDHEEGESGECVAHDDHWHCPAGVKQPTSPPTAEQIEEGEKHDDAIGTACTAHDDHWHCPTGVAEPTYAPGSAADKAANSAKSTLTTSAVKPAGTCTPHDDHWHCPPGVKEPAGKPSSTVAGGVTPTTSKVAATSSILEFQGAASVLGLSVRQIIGSVGLPLLFAVLL